MPDRTAGSGSVAREACSSDPTADLLASGSFRLPGVVFELAGSEDMVPPEWHDYIERNAAYYGGSAS